MSKYFSSLGDFLEAENDFDHLFILGLLAPKHIARE